MPHRATYDALITARLFVRLATLRTAARYRSRNFAARNREGAKVRLRPFSSHERGLFVSVDGPSGAGKSTIVYHLAQMLVARGKMSMSRLNHQTGQSECCAAS